ncbi:MAG: SapC family protein, partial [Actinobacteria bacterium]|nr:SapC family protein [Actinomycetota bacterium]
MFDRREALNRETHAQLRFEPNIGYRFAANLMTVPVVSGEVKDAARDYVLIFDKEQPILHALLGVEVNQNAYVNDKGQWLGRYQPAYIRAYPFGVIQTPGTTVSEDGNRQYTVVIDPDAPQFQDREGERFFDGDGKPTALVEKVQKVLMSLERDRQMTQQLIQQLDEAGILVERHIELKGQDKGLTGFRVVDTKALGALPAEDLAKLRDTG